MYIDKIRITLKSNRILFLELNLLDQVLSNSNKFRNYI